MKNTLITIVVVALAGAGIYYLFNRLSDSEIENPLPVDTSIKDNDSIERDPQSATGDVVSISTTTPDTQEKDTTIGTSVEGNDITAYYFGSGETELLFVGGIHGGYSWNTALVAYELIDYLEANPESIPKNISVTVIPVLNPDGLNKTVGSTGRFAVSDVPSQAETIEGRFNANDVDLNRNFDCDWQSEATWQNKSVSGGNEPFSEPEAEAIKKYIETNNPTAVVVWYSAAGGVYSSSCHNGPTDEIREITNIYADASGYTSNEDFDYYEVTGDMVNWVAKNDISAISVLLSNHNDVEWSKNKAGIEALLEYYAR